MITKLLFIGAGGFAGAVARYLLSELTLRHMGANFPFGTLLVNIIGSFCLGWLLAYGLKVPAFSPEVKALSGVGFLGAFTTFSTFSVDMLLLLQEGLMVRAALYAFTSLICGILAAALGYYLGKN